MELARDKTVSQLISRLETARDGGGAVKVEGTWGSFAPLLAAHISKELGRGILYICPHIDDADKIADDLHAFGSKRVEPLGAWEGQEDLADATDEIRAERLRLTLKLFSQRDTSAATENGKNNFVIPTSIQALCQPIPKPQALEQSCLSLRINETVPPEEAVAWLVDNGFERVEKVDLPGQFARRGGIVDIYAPLCIGMTVSEGSATNVTSQQGAEAVRIEFFGDTIESIREINLDTHRSTQQIESIAIVSAVCGSVIDERELFVNILPEDTIIILEEPGDIEEVAKVFLERAEDVGRLYNWANIYKAIGKFTQLHICRFRTSDPGDFFKLDVSSVQRFQH